MKARGQLLLELPAATRAEGMRPTEAEKRAVRLRQDGKCATCGGKTRGGIGLDVVRRNGVLVGLCRSDRLRWDGPERAAKGAAKRRRRLSKPKRAPARQLEIRGRR